MHATRSCRSLDRNDRGWGWRRRRPPPACPERLVRALGPSPIPDEVGPASPDEPHEYEHERTHDHGF